MEPVLIIRDRKGDCRIPLLSKVAALAKLPSLSEVFEVLPDLSLDGQCKGVLSLLMQQPGIRVALGRFMGLLEHFVSAERQLEYAHEGIVHERYLLAEERKKVAFLLTTTATLQSDLECKQELLARSAACIEQLTGEQEATTTELAQCKVTIRDLQQQLEATAEDAMHTPPIDLDFLDDSPSGTQPANAREHSVALVLARSHQAEAEREAREMAAAAAAAHQEKAILEARMMEQEDVYQNQIAWMSTEAERREHEVQEKAAAAAVAQRERDLLEMHMEDQQAVFDHQMAWMTTESEEAKSAASAAEERPSAEAQRARLLQEQLHQTEDSCKSVFADLTSAQTARTEAERRLAERERASGRHIAIMTCFALEQTRAMEAKDAEMESLRSRLSALEELQHRESVAADAPMQAASQMPSGLMGAVIYGAAFVAAMGDVALMAGTAAVQHLRKSAASTLVMPF